MRFLVILVLSISSLGAQERFDRHLAILRGEWTGDSSFEQPGQRPVTVHERNVCTFATDAREVVIASEVLVDGKQLASRWRYSKLQQSGSFEAEYIDGAGVSHAFTGQIVGDGAQILLTCFDAETTLTHRIEISIHDDTMRIASRATNPEGHLVFQGLGEHRKRAEG